MTEYYLPGNEKINCTTVWRWYGNVELELADAFLSADEKSYIVSKDRNASESILVNERPYFRHAFSDNFARAASFLMRGREHPVILDLGCGVGTQALYLALHGARVIALDQDEKALAILSKRLAHYQELADGEITIMLQLVNAMEFDYLSLPSVDGLYSMFAFNIMQPSLRLLSLIERCLSEQARIAILDGNNISWLSRIMPSRRRNALSPYELDQALSNLQFKILEHRGGVALPPLLWYLNWFNLVSVLDNILIGQSWFFPVSHYVLAERI